MSTCKPDCRHARIIISGVSTRRNTSPANDASTIVLFVQASGVTTPTLLQCDPIQQRRRTLHLVATRFNQSQTDGLLGGEGKTSAYRWHGPRSLPPCHPGWGALGGWTLGSTVPNGKYSRVRIGEARLTCAVWWSIVSGCRER